MAFLCEPDSAKKGVGGDVELSVLDDVSFSLERGKTLGIVGESGCGKSVTSLSIMRLLPQPAGRVKSGQILFNGDDLLSLPFNEMRTVRGNKIAMIFQEPMTALNPVHKIGRQIMEIYKLHRPQLSKRERIADCLEILKRVGISAPEQRLNEYPHQLSGGMRQRVMIAMALVCKPDLLIADEPTTALDVTIQAQILDLIKELQREMGMSVIFITHDLGVIAGICDSVAVMYAGRVVEHGDVRDIFNKPLHPYTKGLLNSIPRLETQSKSKLDTIEGTVPSLAEMPQGCRFYQRCSEAFDRCVQKPSVTDIPAQYGQIHQTACFLYDRETVKEAL
ncbi:MAG: ABC transporter ATP-binding protein [Gammaproteobacteria bacterium]|nr:MAG: ABC transporter ATP-binding protein [Gammaproteobacteria bacterium]